MTRCKVDGCFNDRGGLLNFCGQHDALWVTSGEGRRAAALSDSWTKGRVKNALALISRAFADFAQRVSKEEANTKHSTL